jgi:hypothetical protein
MAVLSNGIWTNVVLSAVDSVEGWTILINTSNLPGVPHLWRRHGSQVVTAGVSRRAETAAIHVIHVIRHAPPPCCTWISWSHWTKKSPNQKKMSDVETKNYQLLGWFDTQKHTTESSSKSYSIVKPSARPTLSRSWREKICHAQIMGSSYDLWSSSSLWRWRASVFALALTHVISGKSIWVFTHVWWLCVCVIIAICIYSQGPWGDCSQQIYS